MLIDEDGRGRKEFRPHKTFDYEYEHRYAEHEYECKVRARNRRSATEAVRGSMLALCGRVRASPSGFCFALFS